MRFRVELATEADCRRIAEVLDLPGVRAYGATRDAALATAKALALWSAITTGRSISR